MRSSSISTPSTLGDSASKTASTLVPLAVDLDGTLLKTDLFLESTIALLKKNPAFLFMLVAWLIRGKACAKREVAKRVSLDIAALPYRTDLLQYLRQQHADGRLLILATAADERIAREVADYLALFDLVVASDGVTNLTGERKRARLVQEFGKNGYDYAGNSSADLPVWSSARKTLLISRLPLLKAIPGNVELEAISENRRDHRVDYLKVLRPQQWVKNVLVFVPLFGAHRVYETSLLARGVLAFLAFSLCASAGYIVNDLLDLRADRSHPRKRLRAFAAGDLPLLYGVGIAPVLLAIALAIASRLSPLLLWSLVTYFATAVAYSLAIKQLVVLDVIVLASLYTLRIMAGSAATEIWPSHWLLAFSTFLFFSLALVKRYDELVVMRAINAERATARGYKIDDAELLAAMGVASGYMAVLVLALYINSDAAQLLYRRSQLMWLLCPLLLYWVSYLWLTAHRGKMQDDPLVFATGDRTSRTLMLITAFTALWSL